MKPVVMDSGAEDSEDEISVGCPSPQPDSITSTTSQRDSKSGPGGGVRSFSILDILNHRPAPTAPTNNPPTSSPTPPSTRRSSSPAAAPECPAAKIRRKSSSAGSPDIKPPIVVDPSIQLEPDSKSIIRPWDYQHLALPAHFHQAAGFLNPNRCLPFHLPAAPHPFASLHHMNPFQQPPAAHHHHPFHPAFHPHHHRMMAATMAGGSGSSGGHLSPSQSAGSNSSSQSGAQSAAASPDYISSDCEGDDCISTASSSGSPALLRQKSLQRGKPSGKSGDASGTGGGASANGQATPLDALFQMTSKTFEGSSSNGAESAGSQTGQVGGSGGGGSGGGSNALFSPRQQAKKKRKSRTAFTNHQIFELEKRFLYQKYLSPADRDDIALTLGLTNAQVITWFQNRRAKLKRDMEELKKDVESAKLLGSHHHHHHHHHHPQQHHKTYIGAIELNSMLQKKAEEYNQAIAAASD